MLWKALLILSLAALPGSAESTKQPIQLALPSQPGLARVRSADNYKIVQTSARPDGSEIGIRARNDEAHLELLLFVRTYVDQAPLAAAKCRDIILDGEKHDDSTVTIVSESQLARPGGSPLELAAYNFSGQHGERPIIVRAFGGANQSCADLQVYSDDGKAGPDDPGIRKLMDGFTFDSQYTPGFADFLVYGEVLYRHQVFRQAAPLLEHALSLLPPQSTENLTQHRILVDETGMAFGASGNLNRAREIFRAAITRDPDYPLYYYNLACADAEQDNAVDAKLHLQQAFERRQNLLPGEQLPDPAHDESFSRLLSNPDFMRFLQTLR